MKRVGRRVPKASKLVYGKLRSFARSKIRQYWKPLRKDHEVYGFKLGSVDYCEWWLAQCKNYNVTRKNQIRKALLDNPKLRKKNYRLKMFLKAERLAKINAPRAIYPRTDAVLAHLGAVVHAIEHEIFSSVIPEFGFNPFVKYVDVGSRRQLIREKLENLPGKYCESDWSAMEAHITPEWADALELQVYNYMLKNCPYRQEVMQHLRAMLKGKNSGASRLGTFSIRGVRMSGDLWTSLGNGLTNLLVMAFISEQNGWSMKGFFEGDDAITKIAGMPDEPDAEFFEQYGAILKFKANLKLEDTDFCGLYAADGSDQVVLDAADVLPNVAWSISNQKFGRMEVRLELLKAKALSLAFQAPHSPYTRPYADMILGLLQDVKKIRWDTHTGEVGWWESQIQMNKKLPNYNPDDLTRKFVARKFGFSVDSQLEFERQMKAKQDLEPIYNAELLRRVHPHAIEYYRTHLRTKHPLDTWDSTRHCPVSRC